MVLPHLLHVLPLLFSLALSASTITHLPGFSGPLPFSLETGYVSVDEVNGVELFYYFIESEGNPQDDPLLLWLTGGPGCSAFSGLVFEVGIDAGYHPHLNLKLASKNSKCEEYSSPSTTQCAMIHDALDKITSEINKVHVLEPICATALAKPKRVIESKRSLVEKSSELLLPPPLWCRSYPYHLSHYWANTQVVREALHIKKGTVREWQRCSSDLQYTEDIPSSIKYHLSLTSRGYRALVYSGHHDAVIPFLGTQEWIRSLNFSIVDDWRSWHVDGQVAGYTRTYSNNLTFATVKGAGHTAPEYRPKECLAMLRRWISFKPL